MEPTFDSALFLQDRFGQDAVRQAQDEDRERAGRDHGADVGECRARSKGGGRGRWGGLALRQAQIAASLGIGELGLHPCGS